MTVSVPDANIYTDIQGLAELRRFASQKSPEVLRIVAQQFEALFIQQLLKGMRNAKLSEGLMDSDAGDFYLDMYDKQIALNMAQGRGIGLADMLVQQLSQSYLQESEFTRVQSHGLNQVIDEGLSRIHLPAEQGTTKNERWPSEVGGTIDTVNMQNLTEPLLPNKFVNTVWPLAVKTGQNLGVDPQVLIAQAALETGWGKFIGQHADGRSSHNLFNIKAGDSWHGDHVVISTLEFRDDIAQQGSAKFRSYDSFNASFDDYATLLRNSTRYRDALTKAGSGQDFIHALHKAGYATDPEYSNKIIEILEGATMKQAISAIKLSSKQTITG